MKNKQKAKLINILTVVTIIISGSIFAESFVLPSQEPPYGNAAPPINISNFSQVKSGGLSIGSIIVEGGSYFSGNVGIGTSNPQAKLDVKGSLNIEGLLDVRGSFRARLGMGYQMMFEKGNQINMYMYNWRAGGLQNALLSIQGRGDTSIGKTLFVKGNDGNVGVGTSNPRSKLDVNGTLKAKKLNMVATYRNGDPIHGYNSSGSITSRALPSGIDGGLYSY
jgi:hypothetical protein